MKDKICIPCEREKAKLPTLNKLAEQRAINEGRTIVVYFDEEDKRYMATDYETAKAREYHIISYHTPLR